jgi:TATA-binding protein-associated factor
VAPVRETAAQALGAALLALDVPCLQAVLRKLQELKAHALWEVRQSGLLGVKYMLAARSDASEALLPLALPAITQGLQVRCWCAGAGAPRQLELWGAVL